MSRLNAVRHLVAPAALLVLCACSVELQHELSEEDANEIYVLLQRKGISATKLKEEGGNEPRYIIVVPKADVAEAAQSLRDNSLPRQQNDGLAVFKKMKGMIPTQTEERAMFVEALGGEVSNSLNRVPGVLEARTIVMIPEADDLTQPEKKAPPSASVLIKYRPMGEKKAPLTEAAVKSFVSSAVPELKSENVTVIMTEAAAPEVDADPEQQMQSLLGVRMTKGSAGTFKALIAAGALLIIAMAFATVFAFARGGSSSTGRSGSRKATSEG